MVKSWVSGDFFTSTDSLGHDESPGTLTFWILTTNHGHIAKSMKNRVQKVEKIKIVENQKFKCMALDLYHRQSWPPSIRFLPSQLVRLQPFKNLAFWTPKFTKNLESALDSPMVVGDQSPYAWGPIPWVDFQPYYSIGNPWFDHFPLLSGSIVAAHLKLTP